jgi:hypothetical protein
MFAALLASLAVTQAAPAPAQGASPDRDLLVVTDAWAPETCRPDTAATVTFADWSATTGACVTVEGLWVRNALYSGVEGYYRVHRSDGDILRDRIGVYGWLDRIEPPVRPTPARLTGRPGVCEDLYGADVVMVMGYCHYTGGPYVALGEATILGDPPERLVGEATRRRLGLLVEPAPDWPHRSYVEARARRWLTLVQAGDPAAYAAALDLERGDVDPEDPDSETHAVFRTNGSVFERLRAEQTPAMRVWTLAPPTREPDEPEPDPADVDALVCFKLGDWRDDRWPVASIDGDNSAIRPYACLFVVRWTSGGETTEFNSFRFGAEGLAEPTAFPD